MQYLNCDHADVSAKQRYLLKSMARCVRKARLAVRLSIASILLFPVCLRAQSSLLPAAPDAIRVVQLLKVDNLRPRYPDALPSILRELNEKTTAKFDTSPLVVNSLEDGILSKHTLLYINFDDQAEITLTEGEIQALRNFLERGGFCYIDAGIKAEFIGLNRGHSFANWESVPRLPPSSKRSFRASPSGRCPASTTSSAATTRDSPRGTSSPRPSATSWKMRSGLRAPTPSLDSMSMSVLPYSPHPSSPWDGEGTRQATGSAPSPFASVKALRMPAYRPHPTQGPNLKSPVRMASRTSSTARSANFPPGSRNQTAAGAYSDTTVARRSATTLIPFIPNSA